MKILGSGENVRFEVFCVCLILADLVKKIRFLLKINVPVKSLGSGENFGFR